jgi:hypothetical protein
VPKPQGGPPEHAQYEALCALAAGGLLEGSEFADFRMHMKVCSECRSDYLELSDLVTRHLPQAQGTFRQRLAELRVRPLQYSRQRFLRHARAEGVAFSREVDMPPGPSRWYLRPVTVLAPVALLIAVTVSLFVYHHREVPQTAVVGDSAAAQQIAELERENSALAANRSQLNDSLAAEQREIQNLRAQLGEVAATAKRDGNQSSSQTAQLLDESRNQEKLLAQAQEEAAHSSQLRINDEASLVEQQARITELTNKLRIASATLDQERQLASAGKDVRELMASRQLHVIDVRDTDSNGNASPAFGRVFLTEGKSLTFYAFDLNEDGLANAKRSFQVWAVPEAGKNSPQSLGFLHADAKAQGRWVLKMDNPELVKEISSVFVTVEPAAGAKQPSGQKMLYAYLGGEANHP